MAKTSSEVQEIYIGLLGRAADAEGLAYWTTGGGADLTVEDLRANIVNLQPEYINGMGEMTRGEVVTELYSNLFNREPDNEGYAYWVSGEGSSVNVDQLVLGLTNGASEADLAVVANKVTAAEYYTENAAVYSAAEATVAVADVDATAASLTASQAATNAIEAPAAPTTPVSGETFSLTANIEDDLVGTDGDDLFTASSSNIAATDSVNGGGGTDTFEIRANGDVAAIDVTSVENVDVYVDSFNEISYDATETNDATITMIRGANGFSTSAEVFNAGDNTVAAGSGITGVLTVVANDEGVIAPGGAGNIELSVSSAANTLEFLVTDDTDVSVDDEPTGLATDFNALAGTQFTLADADAAAVAALGAGNTAGDAIAAVTTDASQATEVIVTGGTGVVDLGLENGGLTDLVFGGAGTIDDVTLADGAKLKVESESLTANFKAEGTGILEIQDFYSVASATADAVTVDVEDSDDTITFSVGDVSTGVNAVLNTLDAANDTADTLTFSNADGKSFILNHANDAQTVFINTTDEDTGADIYVSVKKTNASLVVGNEVDNTYITLDDSTARDFTNLDIDGDVFINTGAVKLRINAAAELTENDVNARLMVEGTTSATLTNINITYLDASGVTGNIVAGHSASGITTAQTLILGSGDDIYSSVENVAASSQLIQLGAGDDTVVASQQDVSASFQGGDGNDTFIWNETNNATADFADMSFIGGSGTDTVSITADGAGVAMNASGTKVFLESIEALKIAGSIAADIVTLAADQLSGEKTTISGTSSSNEDNLTIATDANDHTVDLSSLTVDGTLDNLVIDMSSTALRTDKAINVTTTSKKETVSVDLSASKGITLNTGAGNDTIEVVEEALAEKMTITFGTGKDKLDLDVSNDGATTATSSTASDRFVVTDFSLSDDTIQFSNGGAVAADTTTSVDVSAATSEASSDIQASIDDGLITLDGNDAGNVNSLSEWVTVASTTIGSNLAVAGFVFDGSTYLVENAVGGTVQNVVELTGVTTTIVGTGAGVVSVDFA